MTPTTDLRHLGTMTVSDLPALALADDSTIDRLLHEMMRRDGPVLEAEAIESIANGPAIYEGSGRFLAPDEVRIIARSACYPTHRVKAMVAAYRRPIERMCRPDVGMDRLMTVVHAVREWTGLPLEPRIEMAGAGWFCVFEDPMLGDVASECAMVLRRFSSGFRKPIHHAVCVNALAAAIVYGCKEGG